MDFGYSDENEAFRREVRDFLAENVTPEARAELDTVREGSNGPHARELLGKIADRGWMGMSWPVEYGGRAADPTDQFIFEEEVVRARIPLNVGQFIEQAPAIMGAGTEEQKKYFLPRMVSGEITFCLGYTEPNSGTDLASLQTSALEDGDEFVINGQKMFTSGAHHATHIYLMARTDPEAPKHRGISIFLVPMNTPGISVRPLYTLTGGRTNEVFFENVRVPRTAMLGEQNRGWYIGSQALNVGRSGATRYYNYIEAVEGILALLRDDPEGWGLGDDPAVQDRVAELYAEAQVARLFTLRTLSMVRRGINPPYEVSSEKVWGPDLCVKSTEVVGQVLGPYAQLWEGSELTPEHGMFARKYVGAMVFTIGHGSVQVMRDQIARRGLGLPR